MLVRSSGAVRLRRREALLAEEREKRQAGAMEELISRGFAESDIEAPNSTSQHLTAPHRTSHLRTHRTQLGGQNAARVLHTQQILQSMMMMM